MLESPLDFPTRFAESVLVNVVAEVLSLRRVGLLGQAVLISTELPSPFNTGHGVQIV